MRDKSSSRQYGWTALSLSWWFGLAHPYRIGNGVLPSTCHPQLARERFMDGLLNQLNVQVVQYWDTRRLRLLEPLPPPWYGIPTARAGARMDENSVLEHHRPPACTHQSNHNTLIT